MMSPDVYVRATGLWPMVGLCRPVAPPEVALSGPAASGRPSPTGCAD